MGDRGTHSRINDVGASVCNTPMRGFKSSLYEGGIATPMVFHWPDGIGAPGTISRQVGHLTDVFPTVLEIVGAEYPQKFAGRELRPLDGKSLLPQIQSGGEIERTLCWNYEKFSAIRMGRWKALRRSKVRYTMDGEWQLYDLSADRSETNDVCVSYPEVLAKLICTWDDWRQNIGPLHKD